MHEAQGTWPWRAPVLIIWTLFIVSWGLGPPSTRGAQSETWPPGPGAEAVKRHCLSCHEADILIEQRLTRTRWSRVVDKMIRWGAVVPESEREIMVNYLATHFGDSSARTAAGSHWPPGPGAELVRRNCLTCHESDIIVDQHLSRAQWYKEVDKMARWGAVFPPEEREPMVAYLASHFGPEATQLDAR